MKSKQNYDEYVTRNELESTYNYQKKVFDSKIEEINQIVDKIQECFSLRFGEDLGNNKEIEEIKNSLRQVKIDSSNEIKIIENRLNNIITGKLSELEIKNKNNIEENVDRVKLLLKSDIEDLYNDVNNRIVKEENVLKEFKDIKVNELYTNLKYIENQSREIKENTEEYAKIFREEIKEIGKDGRSRTAIAKQEKTINEIKNNKEELEELINKDVKEINEKIKNLEQDIKNNVEGQIDKLDYKNTIQSLRESISNVEELVIENNRDNNATIKDMKHELINSLQNQIDLKDYQNDIKELKENIKLINNQEEDTERILQNIYNTQENFNKNIKNKIEYIESNSDEKLKFIEDKVDHRIQEKIGNLNSEYIIERMNEIENQLNEVKIQSIETQKKNEEIDTQLQAVLNIVVQLEDKFNKGGFETLANDVGKILDRQINLIQTKYDKLFENKLKAFEKKIKAGEKILKNKKFTEDEVMKNSEIEQVKRKRGRPKKEELGTKSKVVIPNYNVVTISGIDEEYEQRPTTNIYKEITPIQIKEAAQSNMSLDERQEYLQNIINKLKFKSEDTKNQIRRTTPGRSQFLMNFDNEE